MIYDITFTIELDTNTRNQREDAFRLRLKDFNAQNLKRFARKLWWQKKEDRLHTRFARLLPTISVTVGSLILANALWPLASYALVTAPQAQSQELVSPLPKVTTLRQTANAPAAQTPSADDIRPKIIEQDLDYSNLTNWFVESESSIQELAQTEKAETKPFFLSVPALDLEQAEIRIGGVNLDKSLIQYPGTADPGQNGAPVIFGHSVLRQFYSPSLKNPRRYMSIFSKIMTLNQGDKIYVDYDGIRYSYSVVKKLDVKPEDPRILEQDYTGKYLKLVTCIPEGTYLRRGIVIAQLETVDETDINPIQ